MKKRLLLVMVVAIISILAACGDSNDSNANTDEEVYEVTIAHNSSPNDPIHTAWTTLQESLEEKSDGRIQVEIFGSQQLTSGDLEVVEGIHNNQYQIGSAPSYTLSSMAGMGEYMLFDFPYLFRNDEDIYEILDGEIGEEIAEELSSRVNVQAYGGFSIGWAKLSNNSGPIVTPDDVSGVSARTTESEFYMDLLESWGGNPTPMAFGEVYTALQQGTVDGLVTVTNLWVDQRFFEVQDYMTTIDPFAIVHIPMVNTDFYNSLPEDLQQVVDEVMLEDMMPVAREDHAEAEIEAIEILKDEGMEIYELTDEERESFIQETEHIIEDKADVVGSDLLERVQNELDR